MATRSLSHVSTLARPAFPDRLADRALGRSTPPGEPTAGAPARGGAGDDGVARRETELMVAFQASGSSADFEALYDAARGPLLLWIASLAPVRATGVEPLELLQDAFVNVYRYAGSFRAEGPRSFRVWSRTIAGNLVRRSCCERSRSLQDLPEGLQEPRDRAPGPGHDLLLDEERRTLARAWVLVLARYAAAFEALSPRDQAALRLVEVEGASYQTACRALGVGLSNLKMILFRARRRVRASIAADFGVGLDRGSARGAAMGAVGRRAGHPAAGTGRASSKLRRAG